MQLGLPPPAPSCITKGEGEQHRRSPTPLPITFNDLRVLAWQIDIDQTTKLAAHRDKDPVRPPSPANFSSPPPRKKRKMSSSPTKRRRQEYDLPDRPHSRADSDPTAASTTTVIAKSHTLSTTAEDDTLIPSSFASLVNNLAVGSVNTPRTRTNDSATISTSTSYFPPLSRRSSQHGGSRPPSPSKGGDRQKRVALQYTRPPFRFGWPALDDPDDSDDNDGDTIWEGIIARATPQTTILRQPTTQPVPEHIASLIRNLSESAITPGCIPSSFAPLIEKYTHNAELIPPEAFSTRDPAASTDPSTHALFTHAHTSLQTAHTLHNSREAETSWYPLIRSFLLDPPPASPQNPGRKPRAPLLVPVDAQTMAIDSSLLPLSGSRPIGAVKVDFLIQFNNSHRSIQPVLDPVFVENPEATLSAFGDPVAGKTFTAGLVEVKAPGGDREEGEYQVIVAGAGVLKRVEELEREAGGARGAGKGREGRMPVLGFVVHGHWWSLLVVYREQGGAVRVLGPFPAGNTATYLGVFRLMGILGCMKEWAGSVYWEYLKRLVLRGRNSGVTEGRG